jgi:hypothetical protein
MTRKTESRSAPSEYWHARHACGHSVYWSDMQVAFKTGAAPCPWCGAENGTKVPQNVAMMHDRRMGVYAFREKLPNGRVPWPSGVPHTASDMIIVHHRADKSCCNN